MSAVPQSLLLPIKQSKKRHGYLWGIFDCARRGCHACPPRSPSIYNAGQIALILRREAIGALSVKGLTLGIPDLQGLASKAVEDTQEARLKGVSEHAAACCARAQSWAEQQPN